MVAATQNSTNVAAPQVGRRAGEVSAALLLAAARLGSAQHGATLRELADAVQMPARAAQVTVTDLRRRGKLAIARYRKVPYRNRPVAEYVLPALPHAATAAAAPVFLARCWG